MFKKAMVVVVGCGALTLGCSQGQGGNDPVEVVAVDETQEIVENLTAAGFPADDIMIVDGLVYVGRDAVVSLQASREMLQANAAADGDEQYRTNNLVSTNVNVICVVPRSFNTTFSQALNLAIENYNDLGLSFRMERRTSTNTGGCDAIIRGRISSGAAGGSAGFPSNGLPFGSFQIGSGTAQFGVNVAAHVITHELGHCVGLRHSDFFNRSISCGSGGNEGDGGVGAIHIAGTPTGATVGGSLMNSCFRSSESGDFTSSDRTALQTLY